MITWLHAYRDRIGLLLLCGGSLIALTTAVIR